MSINVFDAINIKKPGLKPGQSYFGGQSAEEERGSRAPEQSHNGRDQEQNDGNPEQHLRAIHGGAGNATEAENGCNDSNNKKDDRVVEKASHDVCPFNRFGMRGCCF
jgi:hypothetical protein